MLDLKSILRKLADTRPVFHSEADLQHSLAWEIQKMHGNCKIRLEYPFNLEKRIYLDIYLQIEEMKYAVELKYKTRKISAVYHCEKYILQNHSAQDLGRYDFLKDVERLENVKKVDNCAGFAIFLTNDSSYWKTSRRVDTVDSDFRINEGKSVSGDLKWSERASKGTTQNREADIHLNGEYNVSWDEYSRVGTGSYSIFKYLILTI